MAVQVVSSIKAAVQKELGFTMSFGIAEGKLAARLAGPLHKPSGITVVPPQHAAQFLLGTPILKVPQLRPVLLLACHAPPTPVSCMAPAVNMLALQWEDLAKEQPEDGVLHDEEVPPLICSLHSPGA